MVSRYRDIFSTWRSVSSDSSRLPRRQESFDKFGETLMPIMVALGADPGEPQVVEIHNVIVG
jgi:hypothetical protein